MNTKSPLFLLLFFIVWVAVMLQMLTKRKRQQRFAGRFLVRDAEVIRRENHIQRAVIASAACFILAIVSLVITSFFAASYDAVLVGGVFGFIAFLGAAFACAYEAWTTRDTLTNLGLQAHVLTLDASVIAKEFQIKRRRTFGVLGLSAGLVVACAVIIAWASHRYYDALEVTAIIAALASFTFGVGYAGFAYRCPACDSPIGRGGMYVFPKVCPRCGVRLRTPA